MQVLSYSPEVEAYVQVTGNGKSSVYDLTPDIVSASVTRFSNGSSSFTLNLQNKGWKYNDVFTPMDKVVIFATKTERTKLFSGYINTVDKWTLYQSNFKMSGKCTLYKIEKTFWDPYIIASQELMSHYQSNSTKWEGYASMVAELLTKVGGWPSDMIEFGEIPKEVIDYASDMYEKNKGDIAQMKSMADEFYNVLQTHGPKATAVGDSSNIAYNGPVNLKGNKEQKAVCALYLSWEGRFYYSQDDGRLDPENSGYGDCSSTIWAAYNKAVGIDVGTWTGDMLGKGTLIAEGTGDLPIEKMEPADLILVNHYGYNSTYDHVELYLGDNKYAGHGGPENGPTIKDDAKGYGSTQHDWMIRRHLF